MEAAGLGPGERLGPRLRTLRAERGWSLEELSARCGVSRSMLSQVERDEANPTLVVAYRIAAALGLTLDQLVAVGGAGSALTVVAGDDRRFVFRDDAECRIRTLSALELEKDVELYEVVLRPGRSLSSFPHHRGTREFVTVQSGRVRLTAGEESAELGAGDSAHYLADVHHELANPGRNQAVLLLVDVYSTD